MHGVMKPGNQPDKHAHATYTRGSSPHIGTTIPLSLHTKTSACGGTPGRCWGHEPARRMQHGPVRSKRRHRRTGKEPDPDRARPDAAGRDTRDRADAVFRVALSRIEHGREIRADVG